MTCLRRIIALAIAVPLLLPIFSAAQWGAGRIRSVPGQAFGPIKPFHGLPRRELTEPVDAYGPPQRVLLPPGIRIPGASLPGKSSRVQGFARGTFPQAPGLDDLLLVAPSYPSGGDLILAVALGDVNGDGQNDLVACTDQGIEVLLGDGDGTFAAPVTYSSGDGIPDSVSLADVNRDGKLDLVVANNTCGNGDNHGCVAVLLGKGDGSFPTAANYASGGYYAESIAVADLNGDGKPDIAVVNQQADSQDPSGGVSILLGKGDGTFQTAVSYESAGYNASSIATGDFDRDGKIDLAVTNLCVSSENCLSGSVAILLGTGDGTLQSGASFASGGYDPNSIAVAVGDFNRDGKPDLALTHECINSDDCSTGSVSLLLGKGDGSFESPSNYSSGGSSLALAAADLDGDGKTDLAVADQLEDQSSTIGVLFGNGDGTLQSPVIYSSGGYAPSAIALGDLRGSGRLDVVAAVQSDTPIGIGMVTVLLAKGDKSFRAALTYGAERESATIAGDFNADGKPDMAIALSCTHGSCSRGDGQVAVQLGNGDGTFQGPVLYSSAGYVAFDVQSADFNRDGKPDLAVANDCADSSCNSGSVGVLLGNGDGTFRQTQSFAPGGPGGFSLAVGDFNRDGNPDIAVTMCNDQFCGVGSISVMLGNGDGTFKAAASYPAGGSVFSVTAADFNADGKVDLAVANPCRCVEGATVSVLLGNGDGSFQLPVSYNSGGIVADNVQAADVNADGKLDLVVANQCQDDSCSALGVVGVLLGKGDGTFQDPTSYSSWAGWSNSVATADFNGDGNLDIAVENEGTDHAMKARTTVLLLGKGDGTFLIGNSYPIGGRSSTVADFNLDGKTDLLTGDVDSVAILSNIAKEYQFATSVVLHSSANPADYGQPVVFTATIKSSHSGNFTGSVTFYDGSTALATVGVTQRHARTSISSLAPGSHSITAAYSGDHKFLPSTSPVLVEVIHKTSSSTTVTSSINPSTYNEPVTFIAIVTSTGGLPHDGVDITFKDGSIKMGSVPLHSGVASFTTSSLKAGMHEIKAFYPGDSDLKASVGKVTQRVRHAQTASKLVSYLNPSQFGAKVKFRVRVLGEDGGIPTGTVTFKDGSSVMGTANLTDEGLGYYTTSKLTRGKHNIHTAYDGDQNFLPSHALLVQTVQ